MTYIADDYSEEAFAEGQALFTALMATEGPAIFFKTVTDAMERNFDSLFTSVILPQQIACVFKCDELAQQQDELTFEQLMQRLFGEPPHHLVSKQLSVIAGMAQMDEHHAKEILNRNGYTVDQGYVVHHRSQGNAPHKRFKPPGL